MNLVFQLSGVGFSLSIGSLIEIREYCAGEFVVRNEASYNDMLGELLLGDRKIPVFDLASVLQLDNVKFVSCGAFLVLSGEMGEWALPVDEVVGIYPSREFTSQTVSGLVSDPVSSPYEYVDVWRDQILVQCDVPRLESYRERAL